MADDGSLLRRRRAARDVVAQVRNASLVSLLLGPWLLIAQLTGRWADVDEWDWGRSVLCVLAVAIVGHGFVTWRR